MSARRLALLGLLACAPALAADPGTGTARTGRFRASCEDLGQFCFADACGADQIDAALACRARCPSSVILEVVPGTCPLPGRDGRVRLRSKG